MFSKAAREYRERAPLDKKKRLGKKDEARAKRRAQSLRFEENMTTFSVCCPEHLRHPNAMKWIKEPLGSGWRCANANCTAELS